MKKKLLAVLMTGVMAASFAGTATVVSADSGDDNTLTVNITRLRRKLEKEGLKEFIITKKALDIWYKTTV